MINQKDKRLILELAKHKCEDCKKEFKDSELEIHRIKPGAEGGTYHWRNCQVLCKECHKRRAFIF